MPQSLSSLIPAGQPDWAHEGIDLPAGHGWQLAARAWTYRLAAWVSLSLLDDPAMLAFAFS